MFRRIKYEVFVIKLVIIKMVGVFRISKSVRTTFRVLNPNCTYQIGDGPIQKGNYYKYIKSVYDY